MLGHRKFDLQDYIGILRRRYWLILVPSIICPVLAFIAVRMIPPRYVSTGLIFIDRPTVPAEVVKPMTTGDLIERINAIQEQVLSRTRLEPLVRKYGLEPMGQRVSGEAIGRLRKAIVIAPAEFASLSAPAGSDREPIPGLSISCTARSAWTAQELCMDITTMFIEESLEQRAQLEQGTSAFLSVQLADAKQKLDAEDSKLADLKSRNLGRLPDDQETNLRVLMDRNAELEAADEALDRAIQDRTYTQSLLQQQLNSSRLAGSGSVPVATVDELQDELAKKQELLTELEAHYTPKYPEVATLKTAVEDLKKQIASRSATEKKAAETPAANPPEAKTESPQAQQLRAQIHQDDEIIRTRTEEQAHLKQQIADYEQKLQLSPVVEEEIKNVTRDHETALRFYNDLLQKNSEAEMSASLEQRQQGERFRILDSPNLPDKPDFPKTIVFLGGGLGGGIGIGLALALLLEMLDKSIRDERDIEVLLKIQNVATLPTVQSLKGWKGDTPVDRQNEESTALTIKA
jgi:polysaccharide chain length determinant protein (PEP-CTERM system associated)